MAVLEGIRRLLRNNITGAPVVSERGEYLAVFSERSCLQALVRAADRLQESSRNQCPTSAVQIMARKLTTLRPEMDVIDAVGLLLRNRISGAPVLEKSGLSAMAVKRRPLESTSKCWWPVGLRS